MLQILLNYGFAWTAVLFAIILSFKFVTRKFSKNNDRLKRININLRKTHIPIGILLIVTGFIHGYYSSQYILSFNLGTIAWVLSILLGVNFAVRKMIKSKLPWIVLHRLLTVLFLVSIVWHVIDVGGVQIINELLSKKDVVVYTTSLDEKVDEKDVQQETTLPPDLPVPTISQTETPQYELPTTEETIPPLDSQAPTVLPIEAPQYELPTTEPTPPSSTPTQTLEEFNNGMKGVVLKDGTYTGVADAYGTGLTVSVTVKSNEVTDIIITAHNEKNSKYYARPMEEIPQAIINSQSLDVDTISGATFSSVGIINAVNDALSNALVSGELPPMKALPQRKNGRG